MTASEPNRPNPVNHAMLMGLELGIWFAIKFMISAQTLQHPSLGLLSWLITFYVIYGIYRAAQHYKHFECADKITFGHAYSYLMWLILCASLVAALICFVYLQWLDTAFLSRVYELILDFLKQSGAAGVEGLPPVSPEDMAASMQYLLTPIRFSLYYSMYNMFLGALLALPMALIVRFRKARFIFPFGGKQNGPHDYNDTDSEN